MDKLNKYQEAFNRIKRVVIFEKNYNDYRDSFFVDCNTIQELIDKETPMKPNLFLCPNCNSDSICEETIRGRNRYFDRCECGQLIDWGEE